MVKPPSQTLPPHEGEGLGLGVKIAYSSDWYKCLDNINLGKRSPESREKFFWRAARRRRAARLTGGQPSWAGRQPKIAYMTETWYYLAY